MEKSPVDRKPNRVFRGRVVRAIIAEIFNKPTSPPEVDYPPIGIGTTTEIPHLRLVEDPFENNWDDAA